MSQQIFDQINSISFEDILNAVGIHFDKAGNTLELYQDRVPTDGWRCDTIRGFIKDFSGKGRPEGDRVTFIMALNNQSKGEAVTWYKDKFHLFEMQIQEEKKSITNTELLDIIGQAPLAYKINIKNKWDSLPTLSEKQITYLESRGVRYDLIQGIVKNNNGYIAAGIYDLTGLITIQSRNINEDGPRFMIEKGTNSKGVFLSKVNKERRYVYVTEGMFDFLSLVQYDSNVIGLKSATDGIEVVKEFYNRGYKIILIPDADEAGQGVLERFSDIKYSVFDVGKYGVKDLNELLVQGEYGRKILDLIEDDREKEPINIDSAFKKFDFMKKRIRERGRLGFDGPYPIIDRYTQGVIEGKVYTIGAFSNTGKSQFSYSYVAHFLRQGKKIGYFSLEVDTGMLLSHIAKSYYEDHYTNIMMGNRDVLREDFKNLFLYEDVFTVKDIHKITDIEKFDVIFIDYVQALHGPGTGTEKFEDIALSIQRIGIETQAVVYSISQVNNESRGKSGDSVMLKGSGAFFAASDVVFILSESSGFLKLDIAKNKFGAKTSFIINPVFETGQFQVVQESVNKNGQHGL